MIGETVALIAEVSRQERSMGKATFQKIHHRKLSLQLTKDHNPDRAQQNTTESENLPKAGNEKKPTRKPHIKTFNALNKPGPDTP